MKLYWVANGENAVRGIGLGFSVHAARMKEALLKLGVEIVGTWNSIATQPPPIKDAELAVHIVNPTMYTPIPGVKNLLFTTCEATPLKESFRPGIAKADILVCPCEFNRREFAPFHPHDLHVVPEGIDPLAFPFYQRREPYAHEPFRLLWLGYWVPRKGPHLAIEAFVAWLRSGRMPRNAQLYLKSQGFQHPGIQIRKAAQKPGTPPDFYPAEQLLPGQGPEIVTDTRDVSAAELLKLYQSAHALIAPSYGEAWNLPAGEYMATGGPVIFTAWGGHVDFCDSSTGYPLINFRMVNIEQLPEVGMGALCDLGELVQHMESIYSNYPAALERGKRASERMHKFFTWDAAARKMIAVCEKYIRQPVTAGGA